MRQTAANRMFVFIWEHKRTYMRTLCTDPPNLTCERIASYAHGSNRNLASGYGSHRNRVVFRTISHLMGPEFAQPEDSGAAHVTRRASLEKGPSHIQIVPRYKAAKQRWEKPWAARRLPLCNTILRAQRFRTAISNENSAKRGRFLLDKFSPHSGLLLLPS
jgi:hypothetical protein